MLHYLCHAAADRSFIDEKLIPALHKTGVSVWYSSVANDAGEDWQVDTQAGRQYTRMFVAILSEQAIASEDFLDELKWGLDNKLTSNTFIAIISENCPLSTEEMHAALPEDIALPKELLTDWQTYSDILNENKSDSVRTLPSFNLLAHIGANQQASFFKQSYYLNITEGDNNTPLDLFNAPKYNPIMSRLLKANPDARPLADQAGQQLCQVPADSDDFVFVFRLDFANLEECWFERDILNRVNQGKFFTVGLDQGTSLLLGARDFELPMISVFLSYEHDGDDISVFAAIYPGELILTD